MGPFADLMFMFLFAKITKKVRALINESEFHQSLSYCCTAYIDPLAALDTETNLLQAIYEDDAMHGMLHSSATFVVGAIRCGSGPVLSWSDVSRARKAMAQDL